jgi:fibronectin-binding autotransporter adhesin
MKRKRLASFGSALLLSLSSLLVFSAPRVLAATATWDGGGTDDNMTTAANWAGDVAPTAGDDLVFPANITERTINNDFTAGTSFNSIAFSGTATIASGYTLSGNAMTIVAGITASMTGPFSYHTINNNLTLNGDQTIADSQDSTFTFNGTLNIGNSNLAANTAVQSGFSFSGAISGSGTLTKSGAGYLNLPADNSGFTGPININAGELVVRHSNALGATSAGTTVASGATIIFLFGSNTTYGEPLTLAGNGTTATVSLVCCFNTGGGISDATQFPKATFTGTVILQSNIKVSASYNGKITGPLGGSYTIGVVSGSTGTLEIASSNNTSLTPNGNQVTVAKETKYESNSPGTSIIVGNQETAIVTGTYGSTSVAFGGTLKGTGTVGEVLLSAGSKIAPGLSPGCLNSGNLTFASGSTYDFEVGGTTACTEYDQIKVTGTVTLGNGTLNTILFNNFKPVTGQNYTIIDNDSTDAVSGTFNNLAEGATFTVSGYVLKVTYKGGDGNDVVLSVQSVPMTPNTGFSLATTQPVQVFLAISSLALVIGLIGRRYSKSLYR